MIITMSLGEAAKMMWGVHWLCIALVLAPICSLLLLQELQWMKKRKRSPPGPKGLPIIGCLHILGKNPHRDLFHLSRKHGPIMYMRFGLVPVIIVSSPEAAEKFLKVHDASFASRPYSPAAWHIFYGQRNLISAPYGSYWRNKRKLCTLHLLSSQKIGSFKSMRRQEVRNLRDLIKQASSDQVAVNISSYVSTAVSNMSSLMVFGKKYMETEVENRRFKDVIADVSHLATVPNLREYFPFLGVLDLHGLTRRFKHISKVLDDFLEKIIDDHEQSRQQEKTTKDFVDTMMAVLDSGEAEFEFDRRHVKAVLLDIFITSMETVAASIDWAMAELLRHPHAMKKLQQEIQEIVGMERMVDESDLERLEYLDAVVKETLRLHPAGPLLLPHEAIEDCMIDGFHIERKSRIIINVWAIGHDPNVWPEPNSFNPDRFLGFHIERKSRIIINVWAIGHDPNVWPEPESFNPERFLGSNIDIRGQDFQLLPFGSGRRMCPGLQLELLVFRLVLAQLVHCFNWELPGNMLPTDVDMDEAFGLVTARAKDLMAVPSCRFQV